MNNAELTG